MKFLMVSLVIPLTSLILAKHEPACTFLNYPFMIGIKETFSFKHICAGTLVKPNTVLTLATCISERKDIPGFFTAVAGPSTIGRVGSQRIIADKVIVHKRFDSSRKVNNVGLLILRNNFELSNLVQLIPIPEQLIPDDIGNMHHKAVAIGWAPYHPGKKLTDDSRYLFNPELKCVTLTILNESSCKSVRKGFGFEYDKICAWVPDGNENMCQGDAGGPLLSNGTQYGIVSMGYGCDLTSNPAFYERLDRVLDIFKQPFQTEAERSRALTLKLFSSSLLTYLILLLVLNISRYS